MGGAPVASHAARALVIRYGLLSHALLYKEARNEADQLDDVISAGLLLEHEAQALQPSALGEVRGSWKGKRLSSREGLVGT